MRDRLLIVLALGLTLAPRARAADDEALLFTPPGFDAPGKPAKATGPEAGHVALTVVDAVDGRPTPCRVNVVGPDGQFYQPEDGPLSPYSLTGDWPAVGKGNRAGKGPFRYYGRFFYTTGAVKVGVPAGAVRVEVWKGLEYRPAVATVSVKAGESVDVSVRLERAVDLGAVGYDSGDPHLHLLRRDAADEALIFDLLEAEDVRYGTPLGYNEPAGPYRADRETLDYPQLRGLGKASEARRGGTHILSGQEYRSRTFGHLNLFLRDDLVNEGSSYDLDDGPPYGHVGRETIRKGGYAFYAHGGYAQAIYSDFVKGSVNGVELLQFGEFRGIGLEDWYNILNAGYRFPIVGASDYPACRKLADCVTYVYQDPAKPRDFAGWLKGAADGSGFVTTGPLLLLEVDGKRPGAAIAVSGPGPHRVVAKVRVLSNVAPVDTVQLIVNGKVVKEAAVPPGRRSGEWFEITLPVDVGVSSWVAARAFGSSPDGRPDAESHTNPVYVHLDGKAPYDRDSLDALVGKLDGQMAVQRARNSAGKPAILEDFQASRDVLMRIRAEGGLPASGPPADWVAAAGFDPSRKSHTDEELAAFLEPPPPRSPAEAVAAVETAGPFEVQLVAAEPLLRSPVAGAYDEDGNLYVCEMTDYPYKPGPGGKPLGSVRLLRDTDGDGALDASDVFADGLLWAAGVAPWKGGVFVASPPDIWYMKDTDGDHRADVRRKVFTGFGTGNEQGMLNNLTFGLDQKVYGSTSVNGGLVRHAERPDAPAVSVDGKDFRFDPVTEEFEALSGTVQFGTTFDDFGNRFLCSESRPLLYAVLPGELLAGNPYLPVASALDDVAGNPVPIFRISPVERWRQIRSARRIAHGERSANSAGASHHVIDAAAGVTVYRGGAYPPEYYGDVFVNDAQNNLIHRIKLSESGVSFRGSRVEAGTEFLRSSDNTFRPVNLINAPDGTLHGLDMARDVIEAIHIPLDVVKHLDLRRGRDLGRVYRIAPKGFNPPAAPKLGAATTAELVAALEHPDGWRRDNAHRLLFERQDRSAVGPLRALAETAPRPASRVLALWSLRGLDALTVDDLQRASRDAPPEVVEQVLKLSAAGGAVSPGFLGRVVELAGSDSPRVRFAAAAALRGSADPRAAVALAAVMRRGGTDRWTRTAVLAAAVECPDRLFEELSRDSAFKNSPEGRAALDALAGVVGVRNRPGEVGRVLNVLASGGEGGRAGLSGLGLGLRRAGATLPSGALPDGEAARWLASAVAEASRAAADPGTPGPARLEAVGLLSASPFSQARGPLGSLLDPAHPGDVQVAAVRALAGFAEPEVATLLLDNYRRLAPNARASAVDALLSREPWTVALLDAAKRGGVDLGQVEQARRDRLAAHRNPTIAGLAKSLFGAAGPGARPDVLAAFAPAARMAGDRGRGEKVFTQHCLNCHKVGDRGHAVGPDLSTTQFSEPVALLTHVLEPNRYVAPNYVEYVLSDRSGRVYSGLIASESASSLTLRRAEGQEETVLRSQVEELTSTGKSLMPEDFGTKLSQQDAADLVAFLLATRSAAPAPEKLDVGTLPGRVEPER